MPYPDAKYPPTGLILTDEEARALYEELGSRIQQLNTWIHRASIGIRELDDPEGKALHVALLQLVHGRLESMVLDREVLDGEN